MSPARLAIAVALAATTLTAAAAADSELSAAAAAPPGGSASPATPLSLRPSKPIELAPEPQHGAMPWKVAFVLVLVGGAALYLRRRAAPLHARQPELTIVRRAALGLRSELVVVNVEGQRLLLGVTPHSIQSLAMLDADDAQVQALAATGRASSTLGERFSAMLDTATRGAAASAPTVMAEPSRRPRGDRPSLHDEEVAEQARGLAALRRAG